MNKQFNVYIDSRPEVHVPVDVSLHVICMRIYMIMNAHFTRLGTGI